MKIKNLEIEGNLVLAPMCNVTNLPFRILCRRYGASLVYSEMISADAYVRKSQRSEKRAYFIEEERPIGLQLFGSDTKMLVEAAKKAELELRPDLIDINIGCPAHNVMKVGGGASLLKDIGKIKEIVHSISSSISIPFTCKMRITKEDDETLMIAQAIEGSGAAMITVHGRTARQKYSGKANWRVIKKVKDNSKILIILNGDVKDEESAKNAFVTGCDGLMIGRAAIGNPYLFKRISHYLTTGKKLPCLTLKQNIMIFFEYLALAKEYSYLNIASIKMQAQNFTKGFDGASRLRDSISKAKDIGQIEKILSVTL